jgi:hypothetical protein
LFEVYPDNATASSDDALAFEGLIAERNVPEDDYRLVPPGGNSTSEFAITRNFQYAHGKHPYHFTYRLFAPFCEVLTTKLLQLSLPPSTEFYKQQPGELAGKGVVLESKRVDFDFDEERTRVRFEIGEFTVEGDNSLKYGLENALLVKFSSSGVFAVDRFGKSKTPIVRVPSLVQRLNGDRSQLVYKTEIFTADGTVLGRSDGSCWSDKIDKCADEIFKQSLSLKDRM